MKTPTMVFNDNLALRTGEFGVWDLNIGYFLPAIEAGWELVALPVFVKRKRAYQFIFCRLDRGIKTPKDLEAKRVGSTSYHGSNRLGVGLLKNRPGGGYYENALACATGLFSCL